MVHGSVVHELVRKTGPISVHVISPDDGDAVPPKSVETRTKPEPFRIGQYLGGTVAVAVALGMGLLLKQFLAVQSVSLVFLTAVLASAIAWGLLPSLFAAVVSMLAYNFFFMPPLYTFTVGDPGERPCVVLFSDCGGHCQQFDGADPQSNPCRSHPGQDYR